MQLTNYIFLFFVFNQKKQYIKEKNLDNIRSLHNQTE